MAEPVGDRLGDAFDHPKMNETIIGKIKKNSREEIWVTLGEYHGHQPN
jgi:hypothetical protein